MATQRNIFRIFITLALMATFSSVPVHSAVKGVCSNCHTMHNSQDSTAIYTGDSGAPLGNLLVNDCVGCHTNSSNNNTIVTIGQTEIPIVYNTTAPVYNDPGNAANSLAGGNFYWVVNNGDAYGHNVYGLQSPNDADSTLSTAPGSTGCAGNCHSTLATSDAENGCKACHNSVIHHGTGETEANGEETASRGWFRFLSAPSGHSGYGGWPVRGIEDSDWEQSNAANDHNIYYRGTGYRLENPQSIGMFCAGCHAQFHSPGFATAYADNGTGDTDPWLRHPTDFAISNADEYSWINGTAYDPLVPVGKNLDQSSTEKEVVLLTGATPDTVMCLTCHRAHGSPYPDMLRWSYSDMTVGSAAAAGTGCFKCHTEKDG